MTDLPALPDEPVGAEDEMSLVDLVDHVLNKGVVLAGHATIAVADVDLIYLGLNIVLASVEAVRGKRQPGSDQG
ncbi:MAG TPA: gas vesicle protein [Chloroflexota bacterium]|nr:gas vesicle protein [Chloroflexota bacterium]